MKRCTTLVRLFGACVAVLVPLALAGCGTADPGADEDASSSEEPILPGDETLDSLPIPAVELADGTTYETSTGAVVTTSAAGSCSGIFLKYHTGSGNHSACVNRPCKSNPTSTACRVRKTIYAYFDHYLPALEVSYCESGFNHFAANGQYHGLYQLSSNWRSYFHIGEGYGIKDNVSSAWKIKNKVDGGYGWQPWSCQPGWN